MESGSCFIDDPIERGRSSVAGLSASRAPRVWIGMARARTTPAAGKAPTSGELPGERAHLEGFRGGDRATLEAVYRFYVADVETALTHGFEFESKGIAKRFCGFRDVVDVEDLLHDVFVRAFSERARAAYDGVSDYRPFLRKMTRNLVLSRLRSAGDKLDQMSTSLDAALVDPASRLEEMIASQAPVSGERWEHQEIVAVAQAFLDGLSETDQRVLSLRFRQGRPQAEVASLLGMSTPTLRKRERHIFDRFFAYMRQRGYFEHHRTRGDLRARRGVLLLALWVALRLTEGGLLC